MRAQGKTLGPPAGIPVVVKEPMNMVGFPSTGGWAAMSPRAGGIELLPVMDAPVVEQLKVPSSWASPTSRLSAPLTMPTPVGRDRHTTSMEWNSRRVAVLHERPLVTRSTSHLKALLRVQLSVMSLALGSIRASRRPMSQSRSQSRVPTEMRTTIFSIADSLRVRYVFGIGHPRCIHSRSNLRNRSLNKRSERKPSGRSQHRRKAGKARAPRNK